MSESWWPVGAVAGILEGKCVDMNHNTTQAMKADLPTPCPERIDSRRSLASFSPASICQASGSTPKASMANCAGPCIFHRANLSSASRVCSCVSTQQGCKPHSDFHLNLLRHQGSYNLHISHRVFSPHVYNGLSAMLLPVASKHAQEGIA